MKKTTKIFSALSLTAAISLSTFTPGVSSNQVDASTTDKVTVNNTSGSKVTTEASKKNKHNCIGSGATKICLTP
ncbi:hypothetical protein AST03_03360 [Staphylococcus equorum]|uniref:hypothetical protein n=1 Tax=Staphylococcus TaxID=1279 RepID=UPI000852F138|nr:MULTISPECIES: hypothetical protein [Staphylococcus]OEK81625.1 hypothetical protein AST03_03360 [Staphylococcus equorum]PTE93222.1 hypothetical protein BUY89_08820 [Staphylococcus equorum]RIL37836.1 hypothetical protein BUY84_11310 [Staphylococcus equorum]RIM63492.1 hypothetical protein BU122_13285 [Staphylococcus xylosus]